jgi:hypothetical protein
VRIKVKKVMSGTEFFLPAAEFFVILAENIGSELATLARMYFMKK